MDSELKMSRRKIMHTLCLGPEHLLQGGYFNATLRKLQENDTSIEPHNIMYPIFLLENEDDKQAVSSMPNVFRYGINKLIPALTELVAKGLKSILVFGIIETLNKDEIGTNADSVDNPVVKAVPKLKAAFPELTIACDVCLCPYTSHGHCGVLDETGNICHVTSVKRLSEVALAYAKAGADIVAPSDMMDNRIKAIKEILVMNKLHQRVLVVTPCGIRLNRIVPPSFLTQVSKKATKVSLLSYSCKFASSLYGPFRDTMKSAPAAGDRKRYQLPPGSAGLAVRAAARDISEGADFLMVKPGMPYLDIVRMTKERFPEYPLFVYQVSGEYAMIARSGDEDEVKAILMETMTCMRRAGADCIITYFAPLVLDIISNKQ